jgi:hypothetical protein
LSNGRGRGCLDFLLLAFFSSCFESQKVHPAMPERHQGRSFSLC